MQEEQELASCDFQNIKEKKTKTKPWKLFLKFLKNYSIKSDRIIFNTKTFHEFKCYFIYIYIYIFTY